MGQDVNQTLALFTTVSIYMRIALVAFLFWYAIKWKNTLVLLILGFSTSSLALFVTGANRDLVDIVNVPVAFLLVYLIYKFMRYQYYYAGVLKHDGETTLPYTHGIAIEGPDTEVLEKDLNGIITSWDKAAEALYGYKAEEIIGKDVRQLAPPGYQDEAGNIIATISKGGIVKNLRTKRLTKDGKIIGVILEVRPIFNVVGDVVGAAAFARQDTDNRQVGSVVGGRRATD